MSRSLRKGPYIQESLEKKILAMNEGSMKKEVVKTWSRASMISPDFVGLTSWVTLSLFIMETSLFLFTLQRTWLATSSASSLRQEHSEAIRAIVNNFKMKL